MALLRRILLTLPLAISLFSITYLLFYFSYTAPELTSTIPVNLPTTTTPNPTTTTTPIPSAHHPHHPSLPNFPNLNPYSPTLNNGKPNPATTADMDIEILSFITHETTYDHISHSNKHFYANKHNYTLTIDYEADRTDILARANPVWHKIRMMQDAVERALASQENDGRSGGVEKWFWWIDWDTVITNTTVKVEELVEEGKERLKKGWLKPEDEVGVDGRGRYMGRGNETVGREKVSMVDKEESMEKVSMVDKEEGVEMEEMERGEKEKEKEKGKEKGKDQEKDEEEEEEDDEDEDEDDENEDDEDELRVMDLKKMQKSGKEEIGSDSDDGLQMLLTSDCKPINAGSIIFRPTPCLLSFLNSVRQCGLTSLRSNSTAHPLKNEQDCMRELLFPSTPKRPRMPFLTSHTVLLPQTRMNSYPPELTALSNCFDAEGRAWGRGDFVVHFAGAWAHLKTQEERKKEKDMAGEGAAKKGYLEEMEDMLGGMADIVGRVGLWKGLMRHVEEKGVDREKALKGDELVRTLVEEVEKDRYGPLMRKYAKLVDVGPSDDESEEDDGKDSEVKGSLVPRALEPYGDDSGSDTEYEKAYYDEYDYEYDDDYYDDYYGEEGYCK